MSSDLLEAARSYQARALAFLQDLIRIRSVNGRESERGVAERILQEAASLDLPGGLVAEDPERPNVLVSWGQGRRGFALMGHMDTVAEGDPAQWNHPPFAARIRSDRVYGRGAADNKAGIACGLYTLALLGEMKLLDPVVHRVMLAGFVDEESGASSPLGVRALLDRGDLPVSGAIYSYASDIVCIGHRGLIRLVLEAHGRAVHSGSEAWSQGQGGVNAVTGLAAVLVDLERLEFPPPASELDTGLGSTITPGTLIQGGDFESMVPSYARALVDIRTLPGQQQQDVLDAVQQVVDRQVKRRRGLAIGIEVKNSLPGALIPADHRLALIAQRHARNFTGREWPIAMAGPANEGYMLIEAGIPTLCGFGPTGGNAHAADEWVSIDSLASTMAIYAATVAEYLDDPAVRVTGSAGC